MGSIYRKRKWSYGVPEGHLGVVRADAYGSVDFDFSVAGLELMGEDSIIGRSLVLMTQNSLYGRTESCGVIGLLDTELGYSRY